MKKLLIPLIVVLIAFGVYKYIGSKEADYRHNAPQKRAQACLENPTFDLAVVFPDLEKEHRQVAIGVEMAIAEANNRRNPDGSTGPQVYNADKQLVAKPIQTSYYSYNMDKNTLKKVMHWARALSRQFTTAAVMGFYTSTEAYNASLVFQEAGLLYLCPFATSTRITSHPWPTIIRVIPHVDEFMSAILENLSNLFDSDHGTIRLAVFHTNSIYSDDAETALHSHISENTRLFRILGRAETLIGNDSMDGEEPILDWLSIDLETKQSMLDQFDVSDKLFVTHKLAHYGFTKPGVSVEDLDIERLQDISHQLFENTISVSTAVDSLRDMTPDIEIVFSAKYNEGDAEFGRHLRHLAKVDADIIVILDYLNETSTALLSEIRESGNTLPIIGDDGLEYPGEIKKILGDLAGEFYIVSIFDDQKHGAYLTDKFNELSDLLPDEYKNMNFEPNYMTFQTYKAAWLLAQAIVESKSSNPAIIASRIKHAGEKGWKTLNGAKVHFDSHGDVVEPKFLLKKYADGKFVLH